MQNKNAPILSSFLHYLSVFYQLCGIRLFLLNLFSFAAGCFDLLGIAAFFPLLSYHGEYIADNPLAKAVFQAIHLAGLSVNVGTILLAMTVLFIFKGIFSFGELVFRAKVSNDLRKELRVRLAKAYFSMKYLTYTKSNIGLLTNTITTEVTQTVSAATVFAKFMVNLIYLSVYAGACFFLDWGIALGVSVGCAVILLIFKRVPLYVQKMSSGVTQQNAIIQGLVIQIIQSFKYLKATNRFSAPEKILEEQVEKHRRYEINKDVATASPNLFLEPLTVIFCAGIILYHTVFLKHTIQNILIQLFFFSRVISNALAMMSSWNAFGQSMGGIEAVRTLLAQLEPEEQLEKEDQQLPAVRNLSARIEFKDVFFSYGQKRVLSGINMNIPRNTSIAIVGKSGAGKTTLVDLITGLLEPEEGSIIFDHIPYKEISKQSIRRLIGYVTQDVVIFNDTLKNNITLWDPLVSAERLREVAALSHCDEFINHMEHQYETVVGDRGIQLSGGQRQRIGIARELYKNPDLLILDEATSSLDSASEMHIQESIRALMGKKTMMIIAHRLSTIKNCNCIYVLDEGKIVESGTFDELYHQPGSRFRKMCQDQFLDKDIIPHEPIQAH